MMNESFYNRLTASAAELGITINDLQVSQLYTYYEMLIEKNKVMNLTAITEEDEVITKHFIDSLSIVKCADACAMLGTDTAGTLLRVIDVGTGAGFPGMVLKIVFPGIRMVLFGKHPVCFFKRCLIGSFVYSENLVVVALTLCHIY